MKKSNENNVYIYGAVNKTGILKYEDGLTLIDAIFRSGGFNRFSDSSKVYILSKSDNKKYSIKEINMKNLNNTSLENIILEPNDIVYVEKNNISTFNDFVNNILEPLRTLNLITDTAINIDTLSN